MDKVAFIESNTTGTGELFLLKAEQKGLTPLFLTKKPERYPFLKKHLVHPVFIDTDDPKALIEYLKKTPNLKGVLSTSESYVYTAAKLAKKLRLPHTNPDAVSHCQDKYRLNKTLHNLGLPSIQTVKNNSNPPFSFPVVAKPCPGTGSIGVRLCSNPQELTAHLTTLQGSYLVQEYLEGKEYSAEIIADKGGYTLLGITQKHLGPFPYFIEYGHDFPAPLSQKQTQEVLSTIEQVLNAIEFDFGPAHVEFRIQQGIIYIIEINPRLAGGMIPLLIEKAQGVPVIDNLLALFIGQSPSFSKKKTEHAAIRFIIPPKGGILKKVSPLYPEMTLYKQEGELLTLEGSFKDRIGHLISSSSESLEQKITQLTVDVSPALPICGRGRLSTPLDPRVKQILNQQFPRNSDPLPLLSRINKAHVAMLVSRKILTKVQGECLLNGITLIEEENFEQVRNNTDSGFYLAYEEELIKKIGIETAGLIHIGRSRNDINATIQRFQSQEIYTALFQALWRLRSQILQKGEQFRNLPMPICSQYQAAMPATYAYYLTGIEEALANQQKILQALSPLIKICPLGASAGAGTSYPINPDHCASILDFNKGSNHALAAVASRDLELSILAFGTTIGTTISRIAQDFHLWLTKEFQFFHLPDRLCGISSTMPQKKNPYLLEKIKGKSIEPMGTFTSAAAAMHKVPFANSVEVGTEALTNYSQALSSLIQAIELLILIIEGAEPIPKNMARSATLGLVSATQVAETLTQTTSLSFREAHEAVGQTILQAEQEGKDPLAALLSLSQYTSGDPDQWHTSLDYGRGPGPNSMTHILQKANDRLNRDRKI